jgi:WD40 repeat protein
VTRLPFAGSVGEPRVMSLQPSQTPSNCSARLKPSLNIDSSIGDRPLSGAPAPGLPGARRDLSVRRLPIRLQAETRQPRATASIGSDGSAFTLLFARVGAQLGAVLLRKLFLPVFGLGYSVNGNSRQRLEGWQWIGDFRYIPFAFPGKPLSTSMLTSRALSSGRKPVSVDARAWSPDGSKLTFSLNPQADTSDGPYVFDTNTHQAQKIPGSEGYWKSRWSPDGKYLVSVTSNNKTIGVFECSSQKWTVIVHGNVLSPVAWSTIRVLCFTKTFWKRMNRCGASTSRQAPPNGSSIAARCWKAAYNAAGSKR